MFSDQKYGVKVSVISSLDYGELREVLDVIASKGFRITAVDNGNFVCEKENHISSKEVEDV